MSKNRELIARILEYLTESKEELNQGPERAGARAVPCISSAGRCGPSFQSIATWLSHRQRPITLMLLQEHFQFVGETNWLAHLRWHDRLVPISHGPGDSFLPWRRLSGQGQGEDVICLPVHLGSSSETGKPALWSHHKRCPLGLLVTPECLWGCHRAEETR